MTIFSLLLYYYNNTSNDSFITNNVFTNKEIRNKTRTKYNII